MTDGQRESQLMYNNQKDNDGSTWVCPQCGSTRVGPADTTMCPKGCQMMVRQRQPAMTSPSAARAPQRFRKKPVVIEAMEFTGANLQELQAWGAPIERSWSKDSDYRCPNCAGPWGEHAEIRTLEDRPDGAHFVCPADRVIRGVKGEFYACKPDIFEATYEPAD